MVWAGWEFHFDFVDRRERFDQIGELETRQPQPVMRSKQDALAGVFSAQSRFPRPRGRR